MPEVKGKKHEVERIVHDVEDYLGQPHRAPSSQPAPLPTSVSLPTLFTPLSYDTRAQREAYGSHPPNAGSNATNRVVKTLLRGAAFAGRSFGLQPTAQNIHDEDWPRLGLTALALTPWGRVTEAAKMSEILARAPDTAAEAARIPPFLRFSATGEAPTTISELTAARDSAWAAGNELKREITTLVAESKQAMARGARDAWESLCYEIEELAAQAKDMREAGNFFNKKLKEAVKAKKAPQKAGGTPANLARVDHAAAAAKHLTTVDEASLEASRAYQAVWNAGTLADVEAAATRAEQALVRAEQTTVLVKNAALLGSEDFGSPVWQLVDKANHLSFLARKYVAGAQRRLEEAKAWVDGVRPSASALSASPGARSIAQWQTPELRVKEILAANPRVSLAEVERQVSSLDLLARELPLYERLPFPVPTDVVSNLLTRLARTREALATGQFSSRLDGVRDARRYLQERGNEPIWAQKAATLAYVLEEAEKALVAMINVAV